MNKISIRIISLLVSLVAVQTVFAQTQTKNYLKSYTARQPISGSLKNNTNKDQVQQSVQYVDGLGRPLQSVIRWGSPNAQDMITPVAYDEYGRQINQYLPYEGTYNDARFNGNALVDQATFHTNHFVSAEDGSQAFSQVKLEASPLGRTKKQAAPGDTWKMSGDHTVEMFYRNNTTVDAVQQIVTNGSGFSATSNYTAGLLSVGITHDENTGSQEGEVQEFTDKLGRIVLKKNKDSENSYLETYYVYDDYSNLKLVIPPAAVEEIRNSNNWNLLNDAAFQKKWLFTYEYDGRNRMIGKRVPGAEWVYMVYDKRDRLILTQDGNQRYQGSEDIGGIAEIQGYQGTNYHLTGSSSSLRLSEFRFTSAEGKNFHVSATDPGVQKRWIFTKYDELDRPVMTGFYYDNADRATLQAAADDAGDIVEGYTGTGAWQGYDNTAFPSVDPSDLLTVTFYETYGFTSESLPANALSEVKGQVTGSKTRILGTTDWLTSITFYDNRYRPLKLITENHLGGKDVVANQYLNTISALVTTATMTHTSTQLTGELKVIETYTYDHMDRLLTTHQIISENSVLKATQDIVANTYNALGELSSKNLKTDAQQVDYQYNIRGWLTQVNEGTNLTGKDRFGMELKYDDAGTFSQYNGNIGTMIWRSTGGIGTNNNAQTFDYTYDPLSRLKSATYVSANKNDRFNVSGITYDANGNIKTLSRNQEVNGQTKLIDQLAYEYNGQGNQLMAVSDSGDNEAYLSQDPLITKFKDLGFRDGNTAGDDYDYDFNGNMVLDNNKDISSIAYNHLNLPQVVTFDNGDQVSYTYDAAGIKLRKTAEIGSSTKVTDYLAGKHYINGTLSFFQFSEGRAVRNGSLYELEFHLTDHLGNVRVTIDNQGNTVQRDDYYPFGMTFGHWQGTNPENTYQFNGNENQEEMANYIDFNARFYDSSLGRMIAIDPLSELTFGWSPYRFGFNNPVRFSDPTGLSEVDENGNITIKDTNEIRNFMAGLQIVHGGNSNEDSDENGIDTSSGQVMTSRLSTALESFRTGKGIPSSEINAARSSSIDNTQGGISSSWGLTVAFLDGMIDEGLTITNPEIWNRRTFETSRPLYSKNSANTLKHIKDFHQFPLLESDVVLKNLKIGTTISGNTLSFVSTIQDMHDISTGKMSTERGIFRLLVTGFGVAYAPLAGPATVVGYGLEYAYDETLKFMKKYGSITMPTGDWSRFTGFR